MFERRVFVVSLIAWARARCSVKPSTAENEGDDAHPAVACCGREVLSRPVGASWRIAAARVFQSATPNASAMSSRLWLIVILKPLAASAARNVCAIALASRKSRMSCILCSNEIGASGLALLTRRSGPKGDQRLRYVHHARRAASGRSYLPTRKVARRQLGVNK